MYKLLNLTVIIISMLTAASAVKLVPFDVDKFRLDSKMFSEIKDTADCGNFLELTPEKDTVFGDVILGQNIIIRPSNVYNRRVMVCLSGRQVDRAYIKSIRILDNSDSEERVYIYTRQTREHSHGFEAETRHLR